MRLHRFYIEQPLGEEVGIDDVSTIKQWTRVLRYRVGDLIVLFNGDGYDCTYSFVTITKNSSTLSLIDKKKVLSNENDIVVCLSLIRTQNFELAVQKCVEVGVSAIIPFLSERSEKRGANEDRLRRIAIEAAEQCGRATVPTIHPIMPLDGALKKVSKTHTPYICTLGNEKKTQNIKESKVALYVGPEGGWGEGDLSTFQKYPVKYLSLGANTLRAETAAIIGSWRAVNGL
jgi:16S rRNA (uracil1498-N3)-methyltransferase